MRPSAFELNQNHWDGQIYPRRLGVALTQMRRDVDPARQLESVQVFRGEPSAKHSPKGQAACQRQVHFWNEQVCVEAVTGPLKYSPVRDARGDIIDWTAQEKGIDVLLALAMVMGAVENRYDVAFLVSSDTDLVPALEQVCDAGKVAEVANWTGRQRNPRLWVPGQSVWCHWLDRSWYDRVADPTDYTQPST